MSTLSELLPSGGGGSTVDFVASGTLPNGKPVILKADGTVEVVGETSAAVAESIPAGSEVVFNSATTTHLSIAFDPNTAGKFVIAYQDFGNSQYGTVVVGTVSGTSISFGSEVVFNSAAITYSSVSFDPNTANKFVIAYKDSSEYGTAIVGTVSGTTTSFGSEVVFNSAASSYNSISFDPNTAGKFVVVYQDGGNTGAGTACVGTISGTVISFGSEYLFNSGYTYFTSIAFDPNTAGKFVFSYRDAGNSNYGTSRVGTVSGTTISYGSEYVFNSGQSNFTSTSFDPDVAGNFAVSYADGSNSGYGTVVVGTVSGTSITFGSEYVFNTSDTNSTSIAFDPNISGKFVVVYRDAGNSNYGTAIVGTVSGTSISYGSEAVYNSGQSTYSAIAFDPSNSGKFVVVYQDDGNSGYGAAITGQVGTPAVTNLTATNFVGTSTKAYTNAETATIAVQGGLSTNQTGLTIGSTYYVNNDGTLGSPTAAVPYAISGATYVQNFSVSSQEAVPLGLAFSPDGTKMFIVGVIGDAVSEYTLSTSFDISTAVYSQNFSVAAQEINPSAIAFNTNGTKMFIVGSTGDDVNEYTLGTGFDVSTASFVDSFSVAAQDTSPSGITFNTDGTKMFIVGYTGKDVNEYSLSVGFDVSTSSYSQNFSVSAQETKPYGMTFNADGTKMFIAGEVGQDISEYDLTTGFDVSTSSFVASFSVSSQEATPTGIAFSTDGKKMFIIGFTGDAVSEYLMKVGSVSTVTAGKALSATTLLLKDL